MSGATVEISVDYESYLARRVAENVWSGLSRAALDYGHGSITARWESLRRPGGSGGPGGLLVHIFAIGQDHPEAVDRVKVVVDPSKPYLYGVVVAVPDRPSPLSGALLYQGVGRLTSGGVRAGSVEPALLHAMPEECESYARRLLERLQRM